MTGQRQEDLYEYLLHMHHCGDRVKKKKQPPPPLEEGRGGLMDYRSRG